MTTVYFVRHAQPDFTHRNDLTRPLTKEGQSDSKTVLEFFRDKHIDAFYSSPYKRSIDTIKETAEYFGIDIITDVRLRERENGIGGNTTDYFRKRWADMNFCESGGECLNSVQSRNIAALNDILSAHENKTVIIGTHGTALSTILNYYDRSFGVNDFLRIIDWMPFIIGLYFDGDRLVDKKEFFHIYKAFKI